MKQEELKVNQVIRGKWSRERRTVYSLCPTGFFSTTEDGPLCLLFMPFSQLVYWNAVPEEELVKSRDLSRTSWGVQFQLGR